MTNGEEIAKRLMWRTLLDGIEPAGDRDLEWDMRADDGRLVGAGLYFMRVTTANDREWRKIVLL